MENERRMRIVRWALVAAVVVALWALCFVPLGRAQTTDTSYIACPSFVKNAAGLMVRTTACDFKVRAPASPSVDLVCAKSSDGLEIKCVSVAPSQEVILSMSPAAPGKGHVVFNVYAVDSNSNVGRLESAPSDRRGLLVDLDLATIISVIIQAGTLPIP